MLKQLFIKAKKRYPFLEGRTAKPENCPKCGHHGSVNCCHYENDNIIAFRYFCEYCHTKWEERFINNGEKRII